MRSRIAVFACALLCVPAGADTPSSDLISGTAVDVLSGDTLVVDAGARRIEVRLADIDAPQGSDYYAPAARTLLAAMVREKPVRVVVTGRAGEDRVFGRVGVGELDVNLELVRRGAAWVCWDFAVETYFLPYENDAKRQRRGVWSATWEITARAACLQRPPVAQPPPAPVTPLQAR